MRENGKKITSKQLLYLTSLMEKAGVDPADHDLTSLTRYKASLLIQEYHPDNIAEMKRINNKIEELTKEGILIKEDDSQESKVMSARVALKMEEIDQRNSK